MLLVFAFAVIALVAVARRLVSGAARELAVSERRAAEEELW